METSIFLAKAWGLLITVSAFAFLINEKARKNLMKVMEDESFMLSSGYMALVLGILTILFHNVWTSDWKVVITLFGYLAFIKGVVRLSFPEATINIVRSMEKKKGTTPLLFLVLAIGVYLVYKGFSG
ncbi:MAG: hypothetical protein HYZ79_00445 [Candidatus Melainabacteria bacterium]|nr:hypothetical protein [Candidatus Melainabacteria bacterium]